MTLQEFFQLLANNPVYIILYFTMIPFAAFLAGIFGKGEGHMEPWKYWYAALVYLVAVPGIFAITLSIYLFLFERRSILETDLFTQVLPVASMLLTLWLIRRNVDLDRIPGFGKLSGLIMVITASLGIMWFIDKTRILMVSFIRFELVLGAFIILLILVRLGWSRLTKD